MINMKNLVIFIPAFNEEKSIGKVIAEINKLCKKNRKYKTKIIVVDDGSTDNTVKIAKKVGANRIVKHPYNLGLGAATRTGMRTAYEMGADIAIKTDADLQYDVTDIEKIIKPIIDDAADIVFGSRFIGKIYYKMPRYRKFGNWFSTLLVRTLTGLPVTDTTTGLIAFSRRYLSRFQIIGNYNETQQLIIDAWRNHMRIMEVPIFFKPRKTGKSFISLKYPFKVIPTILRLFLHANPLKVFVPAGLLFLITGIWYSIMTIIKYENITTLGSLLILFGIQIIFFGLLADLISKKGREG